MNSADPLKPVNLLDAPLILSLDLGTSGARAVVYDTAGQIVAGLAVRQVYPIQTTIDGGVEVQPEAMIQALETVLDSVLLAAGTLVQRIAVVGFSTLAPTLLGIDRNGEPVTPVYLYSDTRSAEAAQILRSQLDADAVCQRTGAPIHASYLPAKLLWLKQTQPQRFTQVVHWLSIAEYFYLKLFGQTRCSFSVASWTGLLDRHSLTWDEELLQALGITVNHLSPLADYTAPLQGLRPTAANRWQPLAHLPWLLPVGDGACNNLGSDCATPEQVALMIGTSGAMRVVVSPDTMPTVPQGLWLYRVDRHRALLGGALNDGGSFYAWLRSTFQLPISSELIETAMAQVPPDGHGLTVLPFLAGERSPGWQDTARAAIVGLSLNTTPVMIARAGLEAVAYRFAQILALMRPHLPSEIQIRATGGALQRSPLWTQILADVLGEALYLVNATESSSRGAALLALDYLRMNWAIQTVTQNQQIVRPNLDNHKIYKAAIARQQALYTSLIGSERGQYI
jgi:gluconokinase